MQKRQFTDTSKVRLLALLFFRFYLFFESLELCAFLIRITNIRLSDSRDQFTLMCLVCGKGLEGEKQAVEVPLLAVPFVPFSSRCDVSD